MPLRVGEGDGHRGRIGRDVLDAEHHLPVLGHGAGHATDHRDRTRRGRADGQRGRVQPHVLVTLAAAHADDQQLGVRRSLGEGLGRVPGDGLGRHRHARVGLLGRRVRQREDGGGPPLAGRTALRVRRHVHDPQRCAAALRLPRRPAHGAQGDARPVHTHDHGRRHALLVHRSLLPIEGPVHRRRGDPGSAGHGAGHIARVVRSPPQLQCRRSAGREASVVDAAGPRPRGEVPGPGGSSGRVAQRRTGGPMALGRTEVEPRWSGRTW